MKCMDKFSAIVDKNMKSIQRDFNQLQDKWDKSIKSVKSEMKGLEKKFQNELKAMKDDSI